MNELKMENQWIYIDSVVSKVRGCGHTRANKVSEHAQAEPVVQVQVCIILYCTQKFSTIIITTNYSQLSLNGRSE